MSVVELIIFGAGGPRELVVDKANSKQRNSERLRIIFLKFFFTVVFRSDHIQRILNWLCNLLREWKRSCQSLERKHASRYFIAQIYIHTLKHSN